jgi:type I restriction enzyme S subunit
MKPESIWNSKPLKWNSYIKGRVGWQNLRFEEFTNEGPYLITGTNFKDGRVEWDTCYHVSQERYEIAPEIWVQVQDVLITKDGSIGKLAYIDFLPGLACLNSHLLIIRPLNNAYYSRYLYYVLHSNMFKDHIERTQKGTTFFGISQESISNFKIPLASFNTQQAIASFLDRKTAAITTLIAKKQRLIQLLEEKRTALINQAVTKGLNPNVPMKDSGIPWIGEVPEHWRVKIFKRVTSRIEVGIAEAATHAYAIQGVPIVRSGNVKTNYIDLSDIVYIEEWFAAKNRSKYLRKGDILTVRTGANAGMTAVVPQELDHAQCFTLLIATPNPHQFPMFYSYYINSSFAQSFFTVEGWGSAQVNLSVPILQTLPIVEPPYKEQEEIVSFIQKSIVRIDEIVAKNKQIIEKLKEYRQSLITAAVTGKIDIKEEVTA